MVAIFESKPVAQNEGGNSSKEKVMALSASKNDLDQAVGKA